jgi:hypothetical protein
MNEADIIKGARELLSNGWCRGHWKIEQQYCLEGALGVAANCDPQALAPCPKGDVTRELLSAAELVIGHLPAEFRDGIYQLFRYNDSTKTTHQDVLNVLDKALADLGEL